MPQVNGWSVVYKKAIGDDGSLLFPERLTQDFLEKARRTMGSYVFANQYQNEIIPAEEQVFKPEWRRYFHTVPENVFNFGFIDPAISEADTADFTGITVISVDSDMNWYVRYAVRERMNPSQIIGRAFELCDRFKLKVLGFEDVAFQRAILHFAHEEMKRRGRKIPLVGVKRGNDKTKEMRILALVPRFEWGTILLAQGLKQLEEQLDDFPRGAHDDIIDSLASFEDIVYYPQKPRSRNEAPAPNDPKYESWFIQQRLAKASVRGEE